MRSARPYKIIAVGLLLLSSAVLADRRDRFLFRVGDQVVSVQDFVLTDADFDALQCHLPDSLVIEYVGAGFQKKLHESVATLDGLKTPLKENTPLVIFISSMRQIWKLLSYVDSQEVAIAPQLEKGFLQPSKCPTVAGSDKKMRASFRRWLRVEVYLRSRYAPTGVKDEAGRKGKRFQSISLFVDSLDKQVGHEDFW